MVGRVVATTTGIETIREAGDRPSFGLIALATTQVEIRPSEKPVLVESRLDKMLHFGFVFAKFLFAKALIEAHGMECITNFSMSILAGIRA
ncbi:MAG: hypothetical protein R2838_05545 [Caldilineaceae bacterium]